MPASGPQLPESRGVRARRIAIVASLVAVALFGCATDRYAEEIQTAQARGNPDETLAVLQRAIDDDPTNARYRAEYYRLRDQRVAEATAVGDAARRAGRYDDADRAYLVALSYDAENSRALALRQAVEADRRHAKLLAEATAALNASDAAGAETRVRAVLAENPDNVEALALKRAMEERRFRASLAAPTLGAALAQKRITLEFRDANLRMIFEAISRTAGINFVFDRDVRQDQRATIFVRNTPIAEAVRILLMTNSLDQKVLNDSTVVVYPNTPAKLREYQELTVRSFFLANADPKLTANMLRTVLKTRDVFVDEKLNLVVIRDTSEAVRLAEKLVAAQDIADPEVMLEVEVLEVSQGKLQELGIRWPTQVGAGVITSNPIGGGGSTITGSQTGVLRGTDFPLTNSNWYVTITDPAILLNLRQTDAGTNLLANPRVRVKNREKARVLIGDRVPVITTTAAATGSFVSQSVTYLDVGLKLEVEPLIHLENEVGIKVALEVSSIVKEVRTGVGPNATLAYQIGTRNASTHLRLRDGETQVLAGLISDEERRTADRVPGLGTLPIIGRLFSSQLTNKAKTEIVLLITPRVVRGLVRPSVQLTEFPAGTEGGVGGARSAVRGSAVGTVEPPPPPPAIPPASMQIPGATQIPFGGVDVSPPPGGVITLPGVNVPPPQ